MLLHHLMTAFVADKRRASRATASIRLLRTLRVTAVRAAAHQAAFSPAAVAHAVAIDRTDRFFFLSHRHYLARGLSVRQRAQCARAHYSTYESSFDASYFGDVFVHEGLTLWQQRVDGDEYEIRLCMGNDVLYEGGNSVVFFVNGERVGVFSISRVDGCAIGHDDRTKYFITRKQLTIDHRYEVRFHRAFNHTNMARMCMGAIAGLAEASSDASIAAIRADAHPAWEPQLADQFVRAYDEFWAIYDARPCGPVAYDVALPFAQPALDHMTAATRKRAILRRAHVDAVRHASLDVIKAHRRT